MSSMREGGQPVKPAILVLSVSSGAVEDHVLAGIEEEGVPATVEQGHAAIRYVNPTTGGDVMPTIRAEFHRLRPGTKTPVTRSVGSEVVQVFEGAGRILVDDRARTSDPNIVAAGDCANHRIERYGRRVRLECVSATTEHAKIAAATICDNTTGRAALPWFWSDQYDLKLQMVGVSTGYEQLVLRGDPDTERSFAAFYLKGGKLIAADAVSKPQEFMFAKKLVAEGRALDPAQLADPGVALKDLAA